MQGVKEQEENIRAALDLAKAIFKVVQNPEFLEYDASTRHRVLINKYPNFAQAYPLVLKFIARDVKYNEIAFKKFLDKLRVNPGKGMDAYIERQADYAKFLYIEDSIANHRHWNPKTANDIWTTEYNHMNKWAKKLKQEEEDAKNQFAEEKQKNLKLRRQELLDFINNQTPVEIDAELDENITAMADKFNMETAPEPAPEPEPVYRPDIIEKLHPKPNKIYTADKIDPDWLQGTFAVKPNKKTKK